MNKDKVIKEINKIVNIVGEIDCYNDDILLQTFQDEFNNDRVYAITLQINKVYSELYINAEPVEKLYINYLDLEEDVLEQILKFSETYMDLYYEI